MEYKKKMPYIGPRTKEDLAKIHNASPTANKPMPSLQQQNNMAVDRMNSKIKGHGFDLD